MISYYFGSAYCKSGVGNGQEHFGATALQVESHGLNNDNALHDDLRCRVLGSNRGQLCRFLFLNAPTFIYCVANENDLNFVL